MFENPSEILRINDSTAGKNIDENEKFCLYKFPGFHYNSTCVSGL